MGTYYNNNGILEPIAGRGSGVNRNDVAYVESGTTASRNYSVGQLVYVGGTLYRVSSAIQSGQPFTVGTNIVATSVGGEINDINSNLSTSSGNTLTRPFDNTSPSTFTEIYNFTATSIGQVFAQVYFAASQGLYAGIQLRVNGYVVSSWTGNLTANNTISVNCGFKTGDNISVRTEGVNTLPANNVSINILE